MSYRLFESTSGARGGCMINPNRYDYNNFIDVDGNKQYIIYRGTKLPLSFITSQIQEYTSSVGIMPHQRVKKVEYFRTNSGEILFVYVQNFNQFNLSYIQFGGKEYRFPNQSEFLLSDN